MTSFAAECKWFMPKISIQQQIANQVAREKATHERDLQNKALTDATYGIGQVIMCILGLKDIQRNSLPFPTR